MYITQEFAKAKHLFLTGRGGRKRNAGFTHRMDLSMDLLVEGEQGRSQNGLKGVANSDNPNPFRPLQTSMYIHPRASVDFKPTKGTVASFDLPL